MRSDLEIKNLILDFSQRDDRVRAVLLNGSRANPQIEADPLQDFDLSLIVEEIETFTSNHAWTDFFGERIISQLPDEMTFGSIKQDPQPEVFHYLMLFKDGVRIDLTLIPKRQNTHGFHIDSLSIVWLDKDNLFANLPPADNGDYHISRPTEKHFLDTCNEFWWVCTNVSKGLLRNEITYAKEMLEIFVRPMFMKMVEWKIGIENDFKVSFGKGGKNMQRYLTAESYNDVLRTYAGPGSEENWEALFIMTGLFQKVSNEVGSQLGFLVNETEQTNTIEFLKNQFTDRHKFQ